MRWKFWKRKKKEEYHKVPIAYTKSRVSEREVAYTKWFKYFVRKNPRIIRNFAKAREEILKTNSWKEKIVIIDGLSVEKIKGDGGGFKSIFKATFKRKTFFVKEISIFAERKTQGPVQVMALVQANAKLKELLKRHNAETLNYHLGITTSDTSFFVSDFYDLHEGSASLELRKSWILYATEELKEELTKVGINWPNPYDYFYDYNNGKIIIFDLESDIL
ncbi:MAG: hypothetical protein Q7S21_05810 [archaeon]|nr:hypothetical protein [archaeon]